MIRNLLLQTWEGQWCVESQAGQLELPSHSAIRDPSGAFPGGWEESYDLASCDFLELRLSFQLVLLTYLGQVNLMGSLVIRQTSVPRVCWWFSKYRWSPGICMWHRCEDPHFEKLLDHLFLERGLVAWSFKCASSEWMLQLNSLEAFFSLFSVFPPCSLSSSSSTEFK